MSAIAATRPVNVADADVVLTVEQLWKGLQYKARNPGNFIPVPVEAKVVEDEGDKLVRNVKFGPAPEMKEVITSYPSSIIYFDLYPLDAPATAAPVARVTNLLSYGPAPAHDFLLTFTFAPNVPGIAAEDAEKLSAEELSERAGKAVEMTLGAIRAMVKEGKL
ncbi:hypothetical protein JCM10450v2_005656 [Rhodotorula kratochvilovae]